MKRVYSVLISTLLAVVMICVGSLPVYAYETTGYTLNGGVGNYGYSTRHYYVDSSCTSTMKTDIASAWYDWNYTTSSMGITTPVSVTETTTKSSSVFDFYYKAQYEQEEGILGVTLFWRYQTQVSTTGYMPSQNLGWCQIILNKPNYVSLSRNDGGLNRQKGVVAHEIGHAFGLCHTTSVWTLMYPYGDTIAVDSCTADELNGINYLY